MEEYNIETKTINIIPVTIQGYIRNMYWSSDGQDLILLTQEDLENSLDFSYQKKSIYQTLFSIYRVRSQTTFSHKWIY